MNFSLLQRVVNRACLSISLCGRPRHLISLKMVVVLTSRSSELDRVCIRLNCHCTIMLTGNVAYVHCGLRLSIYFPCHATDGKLQVLH